VLQHRALTISETAVWFDLDRGTISRHLEVVPMGRSADVPVGSVPARQVGSRRLVLPDDVLGCRHTPAGAEPEAEEEGEGQDPDEVPAAAPPEGRSFHRLVGQVRCRRG